jgi:hypothetical protein
MPKAELRSAGKWRTPNRYKVLCPVCREHRSPSVLSDPPEFDESDLMEYYAPGNPRVPSEIFRSLGAEKLGVFQCTRCGDYCLATRKKRALADIRIIEIVARIVSQPCCCGQH